MTRPTSVPNSTVKVAVAICGYNQREDVLAAIGSVFRGLPPDISVRIHYVDDGSCDQSADAVLELYPAVSMRHGTGGLYWGGGMRLAIDDALRSEADLLLWLNADTKLVPGALQNLVATWRRWMNSPLAGQDLIVAGATVSSPSSAQLTYSGLRRTKKHGLSFLPVDPEESSSSIDTMNGNIVLMSPSTYVSLGGLDRAMPHQMGDVDFGLRARARQINIILARPVSGYCARNEAPGTSREYNLGRIARLRRRSSMKELWPAAWLALSRRHCGPLWPLVFLKPYADALFRNR